MLVWKYRRQTILESLFDFCKTHQLPIIINQSIEHIPSSSTKIIYLQIGDLIEDYESWKQFNEICIKKQKIIYLVSDNFYNFQNLSNIYFFALPELNGIFSADEPLIIGHPKLK